MKLHILKIKTEYIFDVFYGYKKAELRKNDRDYKTRDLIHFINVNGDEIKGYEHNLYTITHILKDVEEYGLDKEYCILSIEKIK